MKGGVKSPPLIPSEKATLKKPIPMRVNPAGWGMISILKKKSKQINYQLAKLARSIINLTTPRKLDENMDDASWIPPR